MLSGISRLGLDDFENIDIFKEHGKTTNGDKQEGNSGTKHLETDYLFEKTYDCPVCNTQFKSLKVKATKPKLLRTDPDMRPVYQYIDIIKYDCVVCEKCGYAALEKYFDKLSDSQIRVVRNEISSKFKGIKPAGEKYTYDEAIIRYKLALANAVVKRGKISERSYICLKLAWLYRGKRESLVLPEEKRTMELYTHEIQYIQKAREGFTNARMKEMFPIIGMDEWSYDFLLAELSIECNEQVEAKKLLSNIIVSRNAPERIKNRARDLRDYLNEQQQQS